MVVLGEIAVDCGLEVDDRAEHPTLEPSLGEGSEEVFDGVEPGAGSWREVEVQRGWRVSQARTFGCLWVA